MWITDLKISSCMFLNDRKNLVYTVNGDKSYQPHWKEQNNIKKCQELFNSVSNVCFQFRIMNLLFSLDNLAKETRALSIEFFCNEPLVKNVKMLFKKGFISF